MLFDRITRCLVLGAVAMTVATGCYYQDERSARKDKEQGPQVIVAEIDTGATLSQQPGVGAGAFVEYLGDGDWHVFTTCDTEISRYDCRWDIVATVAEGVYIDSVRGEELEIDDDVFSSEGYDAQFVGYTALDYDHMYFHTDPGETVRFEAYLDDIRDPRFIYWIGKGAIHDGAPSNPVDLTPSTP